MKVLVACEYSGTVRDAFAKLGHDAWSCDLLPTEAPGNHIQGDCREVWGGGWDLMVAHPPCTHLASSGARWWKDKAAQAQMPWGPGTQESALDFFLACLAAPVPRICVENPVGKASSTLKPTQIVQPWWFGHPFTKATCLWLKGLPLLTPTQEVSVTDALHYRDMAAGPSRWKNRSRTLPGFASAMASQWGMT